MKIVVIKKIFNILTKRPNRLLKKDFYLRVKRILASSLIYKTLPPSHHPRLYFDVTVLSLFDNKTGVQRVIRSVYEELKILLYDRYEIIPVSCTAFTNGFQALEEIGTAKRKKFRLIQYKISPKKGDVFLSLEQAFVEHLSQEKTFREMKREGCRVILTVYDLLPLQLPQCFPPEVEEIFEKWLSVTSNFAEYLCDSRTVEKDLIDFLSEKKLKLNNSYWFYPGSNFVQNVSTSGITAQQSLYLRNLKKFKYNFLMVGTIEPRKGHAIILDLFTYLWEVEKDNVSLTFIGKEGWMVRDLIDNFKKTKYFNQNFYWFNDASDSFLDQCYKQTDAVIVASLNEGYGLPILEAAQRNCRIIANDIPIFREVAPKECYFLNLTTPAIALKQLQEWLKKPSSICQTSKTKTWKESTAQIIGKTNLI